VPDVPRHRTTFRRLLGFLRPYKWSLVVSSLLAIGSQLAAIAITFLIRAAINGPLTDGTLEGLWLIVALAIGVLVMWITVGQLGQRPMYVMTRVAAPFIFGTIIVLNMLQNSLFARLAQPVKGLANAVTAAVIGAVLAQLYGLMSPAIVGAMPPDVPDAYEVWLVNALLSVTFPFLIFYAAFLNYWPLAKEAPAAAEPART